MTAKLKGVIFSSLHELPWTPNLTTTPTVGWKQHKVTYAALTDKLLPVQPVWKQLWPAVLSHGPSCVGPPGQSAGSTPNTCPLTLWLLSRFTSPQQAKFTITKQLFLFFIFQSSLTHNHFIVLVWRLHRKQPELQKI